MSQDRDCNTCSNHVQAGSLDDQPPICWTCSSPRNGLKGLPYWTPIKEDMPHPYDLAFRPEEDLKPRRITLADLEAIAPPKEAKPLDVQVGGDHYKGMKIQPLEFCLVNSLDAAQSKVVKYVTRRKGDLAKRLEDLDKAVHVIQVYKQLLSEGKVA